MMEQKFKKVKIVVLGDIGRSPRMQYHALSLANSGLKVNIISYTDNAPLPEIQQNSSITINKLHPLNLMYGPKIFQYALKAFWQSISLLLTLFVTGKCDYLLCQNPPAVPTLPICRFYCLVTKTCFIIDWHNYAFTIMALSLPSNHFVLKLSKFIEKYFGQSSHHNFCVSYAMKEDLMHNWGISAKVLYDRPPKIFRTLTTEEKHSWYLKLSQQYSDFGSELKENNFEEGTKFTKVSHHKVELKSDRPGLIFSSTSWTSDEDFSILMEALQIYEATYDVTKKLPKLFCVITGKGPLKDFYRKKMASKNWRHVYIFMPWLKACDYPLMVGSADLGICLHTSSSGLDLPMKVVDMFGAGLPVCAYEFKCVHELIKNGKTGYTFKTSDELAKLIIGWFENFPNNEIQNKVVSKMQNEIKLFQETRWENTWNLRAKQFFE